MSWKVQSPKRNYQEHNESSPRVFSDSAVILLSYNNIFVQNKRKIMALFNNFFIFSVSSGYTVRVWHWREGWMTVILPRVPKMLKRTWHTIYVYPSLSTKAESIDFPMFWLSHLSLVLYLSSLRVFL